jgi:gas vesicle protein
MTSQDFLFYSVGLGFLILVGFLSYTSFCLAKSLKTLTLILQDAEDISNDIDKLEHGIKSGLLNLLGIFSKKEGGEKMTNKKGMSPLAAGAVGAAVGAAVGIAAVELSDEKNRKIIGEKLGDLKETASGVRDTIEEFASQTQGKVGDAVNDTKKKIQESTVHEPKS